MANCLKIIKIIIVERQFQIYSTFQSNGKNVKFWIYFIGGVTNVLFVILSGVFIWTFKKDKTVLDKLVVEVDNIIEILKC